ncbi:hypothetical protein GUJ93_ZPchr0012g20318 [Zizania palustris]|uniref:Uncharacterized protein n=1 Tax=Zizania palustris TaxID=103762 RepID=A0A8J5WQC6_ZIZPA|nr:hypothetical protein GUJ93_ZPchr0012g20318 [Zizania palustris]
MADVALSDDEPTTSAMVETGETTRMSRNGGIRNEPRRAVMDDSRGTSRYGRRRQWATAHLYVGGDDDGLLDGGDGLGQGESRGPCGNCTPPRRQDGTATGDHAAKAHPRDCRDGTTTGDRN